MADRVWSKILALGASAAFATTASSADYPPEPEPSHATDAVLSCPGAGTGFFLLPGSETCLRIGGQVSVWHEASHAKRDLAAETFYVGDDPLVIYGTVAPQKRPASQTTEAVLAITSASLTDYGPLVTHATIKGTHNRGSSILYLDQAFISAGGLTAGRRKSFFDFSTGYNFTEGYASDRVTNLAAFTMPLGTKASLTASLEDNGERRLDDGVWALRGTQSLPDLVVAARAEDPNLGVVHLSAALQKLSDDRTSTCCGPIRGTLAFAASAGVELNAALLGHQGRLLLSAAYADGAMAYLGHLPFLTDYVVDADGTIAKTSGFSLLASYEYLWSPRFKTMATVSGLFAKTKTRDLEWTPAGIMASLGAEYSPVAGMRIGIEGIYYRDFARAKYLGVKGERSVASLTKLKTYLARSF